MGLQSLHSCLHHIHGCVAEHTRCTGNSTADECPNIADIFGLVSALKVVLEVQVDEKSNSLVCALLDDGWCQTLVGTTNT